MKNTVLHTIEGRQDRVMWVYMPERFLAAGDHLVRFRGILEGGISLIVTMGVDPIPITLSWHVTMLTDRFSQASWIILLMNKVGSTTGVGAWPLFSSGGVWGSWLWDRVLAMSANPGRGTYCQTMAPSIEVSTLGLEVASGLNCELSQGSQEQSHWCHHSAGSSQLREEPFLTALAMAVVAMPFIT